MFGYLVGSIREPTSSGIRKLTMSTEGAGIMKPKDGNTRKVYQTPQLTVFGAVKDLTAGGSVSHREQIRDGVALDNGRS